MNIYKIIKASVKNIDNSNIQLRNIKSKSYINKPFMFYKYESIRAYSAQHGSSQIPSPKSHRGEVWGKEKNHKKKPTKKKTQKKLLSL